MVSKGEVDVVTKASALMSWILSSPLSSCLGLADSERNGAEAWGPKNE